MQALFLVEIQIFVVVTLVCTLTWTAEYKVDVTVLDDSPLVGSDSSEEYRAYLSWNRRSANFIEIGRTSNTGTGEIGQGYMNPRDGPSVPQESGFPVSTYIDIESNSDKWRRMEVKMPRSRSLNRIGVFYATTEYNSNRVTIPIIKMSESATIKPVRYTRTIGIGESITLRVTSTVGNLRWVHNNGDVISRWDDQTEVTINVVRLADEGIYECFEEGRREMGEHAIMRLIVRTCPSGKYGSDCSSNCATCWNGGVCAADDGTCLCQPGFSGGGCGQRGNADSNYWGAFASLYCSSGGGNCRGALICGPDPIGCSCVAGYTGLDCNTACPDGFYGSNCDRKCNCNDCHSARGCDSGCYPGYEYNYCQGRNVCPDGYFGAECDFTCHCQGGDFCDKTTGVCDNGKCAYGWGGDDCQQALPYFYDDDQLKTYTTSTSVFLTWRDWNKAMDYGTGPIDHYMIFYWTEDDTGTLNLRSSDSKTVIFNLSIESLYYFAVAAVKVVNGESLEGPSRRNVSATTGCGAPNLSPTITDVSQSNDNEVRLAWSIPPGSDWMQCSEGLTGFIITYYANSSTENTTEITTDAQVTSFDFTLATPCDKYRFRIRAKNKGAEGDDSITKNVNFFVAPGTVESVQLQDDILQWNEPESTCAVIGYSVIVTLINLGNCEQTNRQVADTMVVVSNITLPGMHFFSTYEVSIQAWSGDSSFAMGDVNTMEFETPEAAPSGPPQEVNHKSPEDGILNFTWDLPSCGQRNGQIVRYEYEYWIQSLKDDVKNGSTTYEEITLSDLHSNKTYVFQVRAYTKEGPGPFSEIYEAEASGSSSGKLRATV
ncbi:uncharacterized protein [Amphiura filiformis]|uniref:uncharacterized protein n=1 Tax=Amphiura filiformis TaxID=82378 RepID=UPI003B21C99C